MPYAAQNQIIQKWRALDLNNPPGVVSGLTYPAGIALDIERSSGNSFIAASESIGFAETAVLGDYSIYFTPQNSGTYFLTVQELSALTMQRNWIYTYEVLPAGALFIPSAAGCFCAVSDVARYAGLTFTNTSSPVTSDMALGFCEERAAGIMAMCAFWGFSVNPATVETGSILEDLLRSANAIGAAIDAVVAWYAAVEPSESEKVRSLMQSWINLMGDGAKIKGAIQLQVESSFSASGVRTHISSGEVTLKEETPITDGGLALGMSMDRVF